MMEEKERLRNICRTKHESYTVQLTSQILN